MKVAKSLKRAAANIEKKSTRTGAKAEFTNCMEKKRETREGVKKKNIRFEISDKEMIFVREGE